MPGGHLQVGSWFLTEQVANGLQGLSVAQGLIQALFWQAWEEGHSKSEEQPISRGTTKRRSVWNYLLHYDIRCFLPIGSHCKSPLPVNPGSQTQTIVLSGKSSWTVQTAFGAQGSILRQGFWQSPSKQACLLGQSASCLQELSSGTGRGTEQKRMDENCWHFWVPKIFLRG